MRFKKGKFWSPERKRCLLGGVFCSNERDSKGGEGKVDFEAGGVSKLWPRETKEREGRGKSFEKKKNVESFMINWKNIERGWGRGEHSYVTPKGEARHKRRHRLLGKVPSRQRGSSSSGQSKQGGGGNIKVGEKGRLRREGNQRVTFNRNSTSAVQGKACDAPKKMNSYRGGRSPVKKGEQSGKRLH